MLTSYYFKKLAKPFSLTKSNFVTFIAPVLFPLLRTNKLVVPLNVVGISCLKLSGDIPGISHFSTDKAIATPLRCVRHKVRNEMEKAKTERIAVAFSERVFRKSIYDLKA